MPSGKTMGEEKRELILKLHKQGCTAKQISIQVRLSATTINTVLKEARKSTVTTDNHST